MMGNERWNVSNVVYDSRDILCTFKIEGVHIQAYNTTITNDRQNLRQFHHHRSENDEVTHNLTKHVGKEL